MISYEPLHRTLAEKGMVISDMRDVILNSRTIANINRNQSVRLSTIAAICAYLDVPIEKVVEVIRR
ncbi:MAG: helix-turn-helix domain-containing protein [Bacillota bacterium]